MAALCGLLVAPILTLLHELGHAIPVLASGGKAEILLGERNYRITLKLKNLQIRIAGLSFFNGHCYWERDMPARLTLLALVLGPLVSLAMSLAAFSLIFTPGYASAVYSLATFIAVSSAIQFLMTALPMQYPRFLSGYAGMQSDGYQIVQVLRQLKREI
ncbi:hypothetical protein [Spongorhabdus nitratireducens]